MPRDRSHLLGTSTFSFLCRMAAKMLVIRFLDRFYSFRFKFFVTFDQVFRSGRHSRAPSRLSAHLFLEEGKPQSLLHEPNQPPGLVVGHAHLLCGAVKGIRLFDLSQELAGALPEDLFSPLTKPYFTGRLDHRLHRYTDVSITPS